MGTAIHERSQTVSIQKYFDRIQFHSSANKRLSFYRGEFIRLLFKTLKSKEKMWQLFCTFLQYISICFHKFLNSVFNKSEYKKIQIKTDTIILLLNSYSIPPRGLLFLAPQIKF